MSRSSEGWSAATVYHPCLQRTFSALRGFGSFWKAGVMGTGRVFCPNLQRARIPPGKYGSLWKKRMTRTMRTMSHRRERTGEFPEVVATSLGSPHAFLPVVVGAKVVHLHRRTREGLVVTPVPRLEELGYQLVSVGRPPLLARIFSLVSVEDHSSALRALPPVKLG